MRVDPSAVTSVGEWSLLVLVRVTDLSVCATLVGAWSNSSIIILSVQRGEMVPLAYWILLGLAAPLTGVSKLDQSLETVTHEHEEHLPPLHSNHLHRTGRQAVFPDFIVRTKPISSNGVQFSVGTEKAVRADSQQHSADGRKISPRLAALWQRNVSPITPAVAPPAANFDNNIISGASPTVEAADQVKLQQLQSLQSAGLAGRALPAAGSGKNLTAPFGKIELAPLLREDGKLYYEDLRASANGRHLLLVTLLEKVETPLWEPRAQGRILFYLPDSLRSAAQPHPPPAGALVLPNIVEGGAVVNRSTLLLRLLSTPATQIRPEEAFSRFKPSHSKAVMALVNLVLAQSHYDSLISMLAFSKEICNYKVFVETAIIVIHARQDVGFVLPSLVSITPEEFFPLSMRSKGAGGRQKRQAGFVRRISWNDATFRTLPDTDPESQLWYFREDPLVNSHHYHWHMALSNTAVPTWHPSHSGRIDRRGEMFVFMHRQMLARYNAERVALGMPLVDSFDRQQWSQPVAQGYDSRLTQVTGRRYTPRTPGLRLARADVRSLQAQENAILTAIQNMQLNLPTGTVRLGYANGVDFGISPLGDAIEAINPNTMYGNMHNNGHTFISRMNAGSTADGVMGTPNTAMRDVIFMRWHKYIDDLVLQYKNRLPPYGDADLNFPGVTVTGLSVQTAGQAPNQLFTYLDTTSVRLFSLDFTRPTGSMVDVFYDRLNNVQCDITVRIRSDSRVTGLGRLFLIPAGLAITGNTDITQVAIEMDRFLLQLNAGDNVITRGSRQSPLLSKAPMGLSDLQTRLIQGQISEDTFNWAGCGWPEEMALPRGRQGGMQFRLFFMASALLPTDRALTADWQRLSMASWSWCGLRRSDGDVPDSRPMGFPLDRNPPGGDWRVLLQTSTGQMRPNMMVTDITINYDPIGTTGRRATPAQG